MSLPKPPAKPEKTHVAESKTVHDREKVERTKNLDAAMAEIEKSYGKGAIMRLGDEA
jgi:hypothetical protein